MMGTERLSLTRRGLLALGGAATVAAFSGIRVTYAAGPSDRPLILVLLRGGPDGQALLPLHGDPAYRSVRSSLALPAPDAPGGLYDLDGVIGLHPNAGALIPYWEAGQLAVLPSVASPYRGTSHAEAMSVLDSGSAGIETVQDSGWLNRAIAAVGAAGGGGSIGHPIGSLPHLLRGEAPPLAIGGTEPPSADPRFLAKVQALYTVDAALGEALQAGRKAHDTLAGALGEDHAAANAAGRHAQTFPLLARTIGRAMAGGTGPGCAVIEIGGWDTHIQQGTDRGPLSRRIAGLAEGLAQLADSLGTAFAHSMIVTIGEFGRSVPPNRAGGTEHGLGGAALVLGGGVSGTKRLGPLPKLDVEALERDGALSPTVDSRALFKAVLAKHWMVSASALNKRVFPDSGTIAPLPGL